MTAVATPPQPNAEPPPASAPRRVGPLPFDAAIAVVVGAALVATASVTKTPFDTGYIGANTWTEIALVLLGAGSAIGVAIVGARGRGSGVPALALFAALVALTFASIGWSVQPADSWIEGNRTLSYLAVFAGAMALARIVPRRWASLIGAVAISSCALSTWALLAKVFPGALDAADTLGRLSAPFGYWNATALAAALGLPAVLWAGSRPGSPRALSALTVPAITVLVTALFLSFGRGALIATVLGLGVWFALVPFRTRAAAVLLLGIVGAVVPIVWATASRSLTDNYIGLGARISAGRWFGLVLLLTIGTVAIAAYALAGSLDRIAVPEAIRRRSRAVLTGAAVLVPVALVVALAASTRGFTGEVSHLWSQLTSPSAHVGSGSARLVQLGSSRPVYWREGLLVGEHAAFKGVGAGGFEVASLRYARNSHEVAAQAHSYVVQTFADLGAIGLALSLALVVAWALAAARPLGVGRHRAGPEHGVERAGVVTLLTIVLIFGIHSAVDWTWFVPGVALPALACAGWLAGRGRLSEPVGRRQRPRRLASSPGATGAVLAIATVALAGAWAIWQPLRSANALSDAQAAQYAGNTQAAFADARSAAGYDPKSIDPLSTLGALYNFIGDRAAARLEFARAVSLQPDNPAAWQQLGEYDYSLHRLGSARAELAHARLLDPSSVSILDDVSIVSAQH